MKKHNPIDELIALRIAECRLVLRDIGTLSAITACFNLTAGYIRLCGICGEKEEVKKLVKELCDGLMDEFE